MSVFKKLALLIPPINRLHRQRNQLVIEKQALFSALTAIETEFSNLERECETLRTEMLKTQGQLDAAKKSSPPYLFRRQLDIEAVCQRSQEARAYATIHSLGRTATQWIAGAFNLHPQVFFSHGPDLEPEKNVADADRELVSTRIHQQMKSFDFSDIDGYFDLLVSRGDYIVYGNIHGLTAIPNNPPPSLNRFRRSYYSCAIFRHPVPRVQSFINKWSPYLPAADNQRRPVLELDEYRENNEALLNEIGKTHHVQRFDDEAVLFIRALGATLSYDKHCYVSGIPLFQMERLVSDTDYFLGLFHDVTAGLVEPTGEYLSALRKLKPIDRSSKEEILAGPLFRSWDSWKQKYFLDEMHKEGMFEIYDLLGYNLEPLRKVRH